MISGATIFLYLLPLAAAPVVFHLLMRRQRKRILSGRIAAPQSGRRGHRDPGQHADPGPDDPGYHQGCSGGRRRRKGPAGLPGRISRLPLDPGVDRGRWFPSRQPGVALVHLRTDRRYLLRRRARGGRFRRAAARLLSLRRRAGESVSAEASSNSIIRYPGHVGHGGRNRRWNDRHLLQHVGHRRDGRYDARPEQDGNGAFQPRPQRPVRRPDGRR